VLTIKADFMQNRETNLGGLPVDPLVGSNDTARIARGLPRDWQFGNEIDRRHRHTERISFELLSTLGSRVTSRLYFMGDHVDRRDVGGTSAGLTNGGGGSVNPSTGLYEPGVNWTTTNNADGTVTPVATAAPVTDPSTWVYTRNNGLVDLDYLEAHLKNDYAAKFDFAWATTTTITGFAANSSRLRFKSWTPAARPSVPANNLGSITYPAYVFAPITPSITAGASNNFDRTGVQTDLQAFIYEKMDFWKERIQLSGGVSRFFGTLSRVDNNGTGLVTAFPNAPAYRLSSNATSFGVVVKPIKGVSLFYSRNTTGGAMPSQTGGTGTTDPALKTAVGGQEEFGVKTSLLDNKLTASIAHFDITQANYAVTNSDYYAAVAAGLPTANISPTVYMNIKSKGWEAELTYSFSKNFTLLANATNLKARQPPGDVRVRGVPDKIYGIYADYRFTEGKLNGFGVNVGVDYKSDVVGTNATGYTTTKPIAGITKNGGFVPNQPTFLVGGRTLVNVGFTYKYRQNWSFSLTVMNALDKDYILAAGSRTSAVVGTPRAWKTSMTYQF
jgi:iron complex outermembrane receptor protein